MGRGSWRREGVDGGGGGLPAERWGGIGGSSIFLVGGDSIGLASL